MAAHTFHPLIQAWFSGRFDAPTEPQKLGWPHIAAGHHTLIAAPTGSGKTLAAFLVCIDRLWRDSLAGQLADGVQVLYLSPLKALGNDIQRNLQAPLAEISALAAAAGQEVPSIRTAVRSGDTPPAARQAMVRKPPHILVTTPESLYLLLTSSRSREMLRTVKTVIVDEIHALARDKRGSHLALSLERLACLTADRPVRIGLSATQRPIEQIARFLVGSDCRRVHLIGGKAPVTPAVDQPQDLAHSTHSDSSDVFVIDSGHIRQLDLKVELPPSELSAVCSHEQWDEAYARLVELIQEHRSTLIFVNTRRLAERVAHRLRDLLGQDAVAGHHGSLSRERRLDAEQRLKNGELKAIVATASLEMGIDIGFIDLVCQVGSPRSIATALQRVGRSGHSLGLVPKGRMFPLTRDELLESMAVVRAVRRGVLDQIEIPVAPLDILAQQMIASVAAEPLSEAALLEMVRRAWPYRDLTAAQFDGVLTLVSEGLTANNRSGAYLHRDRVNRRLRPRRAARLAAITSGGAIPEAAEYRVIAQPDDTFVGRLDEDFAIESMAGDVFLLGNSSWRVQWVRAGEVVVKDAKGAPPSVPFWFGEAPGRTVELSEEVSRLRADIAAGLDGWPQSDADMAAPLPDSLTWLVKECGENADAAGQAVAYVRAQIAAVGVVPTQEEIVFERFFDESGGMQVVIHAPLGARINRAWGLAMRKRFCRSFDFELQAAATDNGILLSIGPQHSFPLESLFKMLGPHNGEDLLRQAVLAAPMFQVRWRWNVTRALAVLRYQAGKKVPPHLQRFRSDDLLAAAFPETVGCLENHHGDVPIPAHPMVQQTMHDCLTEAMDVERWIDVLRRVQAGHVRLVARDTREPSPFSYELLNANPYAFLDDAPLEERRTRAVTNRHVIRAEDVRDLARLDPAAIEAVREEAWPLVRDEDELHDALCTLTLLGEHEGTQHGWQAWFASLVAAGRATTLRAAERQFWVAAEGLMAARSLLPDATASPALRLPPELAAGVPRDQALAELLRGRLQVCGPVTAEALASGFGIPETQIHAALEALEGRGVILRGHFEVAETGTAAPGEGAPSAHGRGAAPPVDMPIQWCDRRLLARIHRRTMDGLRRRIEPVSPETFVRFLACHQRLTRDRQWAGQVGVREAISQLQGFDLPAGLWESVLAARVDAYDPQWTDQLFLSGEVAWGRLRVPARDDKMSNKTRAAINRAMPISLILRSELCWLVPRAAEDAGPRSSPAHLSARSQRVFAALEARGALFFRELAAVAELLPTELEEALRELAAAGVVTSDAFAPIRGMTAGRAGGRGTSARRRAGRRGNGQAAASGIDAPNGRWSLFPGHLGPLPDEEQRLERWCRLLVHRYGVMFRDLLARESAAPSWKELVRVFRQLELRGEVRGGRFVLGVGGEQFASEAVIEPLRELRDAPREESWQLISAADPLNLSGIVTDGPRVPAMHKNALVLRDGTCVAVKRAEQIEFLVDLPLDMQVAMRRALQTGRMEPASHIRPAWTARDSQPASPPRELSSAPSRTMRY